MKGAATLADPRFAVWAPNAERVSVVGDFNAWDGRLHTLGVPGSGVWELFVPGVGAGALYKFALQAAWPGKKLSFMGNEFGQAAEWNAAAQLAWGDAAEAHHAGVARLVRDLARLYRDEPALHELDFDPEGFEWIDCHDADPSVLAFLRRARSGALILAVFNFTPVVHRAYRIAVRGAGGHREARNTDSRYYGGSDVGNAGFLRAAAVPAMGHSHSIEVTLPPLAAILLTPDRA